MTGASLAKRGFSFNFQSSDLDQFREVIGRSIRPCRFRARAVRYETRLQHHRLGGVGFSIVSVGPEIDVAVDPVEDSFLIQSPLSGSFAASCLGPTRVYRQGDLHVVNPTAPLRVAMHADTQLLIIRIEKSTIEEHARVLGNTAVVDLQRLLPEALPVAGEKGASLRRYLEFLRAEAMAPESVLREEGASRSAEQMLVSLMLALGKEAPAARNEAAAARRAEEYIDAHRNIGIVDVVRAAAVDASTLEAAFRRRRGTDPMSWSAEHGRALPQLTERELEIAHLVPAGLNNGEIASCLAISRNTVKEALKRIFRKMEVDSRAELVTRLAEAGLLKI